MRNLRLDICYDGTRYRGWQRLSGVDNTIQGKLEQTLSRILGETIEISGSGRTDAGVHANEYYFNVRTNSTIPVGSFPVALASSKLPGEISVYSCVEVDDDFNARFDCVKKEYIYLFENTKLLL